MVRRCFAVGTSSEKLSVAEGTRMLCHSAQDDLSRPASRRGDLQCAEDVCGAAKHPDPRAPTGSLRPPPALGSLLSARTAECNGTANARPTATSGRADFHDRKCGVEAGIQIWLSEVRFSRFVMEHEPGPCRHERFGKNLRTLRASSEREELRVSAFASMLNAVVP